MSRRFVAFLLILVLLNGCRRHTSAGQAQPAASGSLVGAIACDPQGNLYVAQRGRNRVLRITPEENVTVFAGTGEAGTSGDGGPAKNARLFSPTSIAFDPNGNLFIADTGNNRMRRVDAKTQVITAVEGNAFAGNWSNWSAKFPDGQAADFPPIQVAADGEENLYISGLNGMGIHRLSASSHEITKLLSSGDPGDPSNPVSNIQGPYWLAYDHDGLFYGEPNRNAVSLLHVPLHDVQRLAGGGECGFSGDHGPAPGALLCAPHGVTTGVAHGAHVLVIADSGNSRIREINLDTGSIETVAGNGETGYTGDRGPAVNASLNGPLGVAIDKSGNIYIADTGNQCIRKVNASDGTIRTWANGKLNE
jgi:sugar lactone lactonase YvrE